MGRRTLTGLGAVAAAIIGLMTAAAPAEEARPTTVHVSLMKTIFGDMPANFLPIVIRPIKALMETQTGVSGQFDVADEVDGLGKQLKDDDVQLGVFHGIEFAWAKLKQPKLKALVIAVNEHPYLRAHVIVRKDSKFTECSDLCGKVIALPHMSREHCKLFLARRCVPEGETPEKCFSEVTTPCSAEDALDDVVDDKAQAAIIDAVDFETFQTDKPGRAARLKSLVQSEPFPCAVIAYNPGALSETMLDRFRDGMTDAQTTDKGKALLKLCRITGFEPPPEDYEQMLADIAKAYPPPAK
jgi:ABC-type phosphate/phosphonate transport system substrate-binding protein